MPFPTFSFADGSFDIGRFDRAPVILHPGFFAFAFVLTFGFWWTGHGAAPMLVTCAIAITLGSILIHELAHAAVARHYRVPIRLIEINFYGGLVHLAQRPWRRSHDVAITLAGPMSNLLIAAAALLLLWALTLAHPVMPRFDGDTSGEMARRLFNSRFYGPSVIERLLRFAFYLNAGLGVVNLLPAFPLDGGRLLYIAVARRRGARTATLVVGACGTVFAVLSGLATLMFLLAGIFVMAPPSLRVNWDTLTTARHGGSVSI